MITTTQLIVLVSIASLISFALGCLVVGFIFRRQFKNQSTILKRYEANIIGLMHSIHHKSFIPRLKRIRGLINLLQISIEKIRKLEEFAIRPNHENYISLVVLELKDLSKFTLLISSECLEMETEIVENAKKYE